MSQLDQMLGGYAPPPVPEGLAARVAAAAIQEPQDRGTMLPWRRGSVRGGWRRGTLIGSAALGLAFTSAVAAEVASGGRIEIPVVHQMVEAVPILKATTHRAKPEQLASLERRHVAPQPHAERAPAAAEPDHPVAGTPRERFIAKFTEAKKEVAERRAAGLPTPNADRIERKAKRMVERRQAAGLPAPSLDEAEMRVAVREWAANRILRRVANNPQGLTDAQVQRFIRILPPKKRDQFSALAPEQQRQMMGQMAQRVLARRMQAQVPDGAAPPADQQAAEIAQQPSEGSPDQPR
jgi:hypothetical protein